MGEAAYAAEQVATRQAMDCREPKAVRHRHLPQIRLLLERPAAPLQNPGAGTDSRTLLSSSRSSLLSIAGLVACHPQPRPRRLPVRQPAHLLSVGLLCEFPASPLPASDRSGAGDSWSLFVHPGQPARCQTERRHPASPCRLKTRGSAVSHAFHHHPGLQRAADRDAVVAAGGAPAGRLCAKNSSSSMTAPPTAHANSCNRPICKSVLGTSRRKHREARTAREEPGQRRGRPHRTGASHRRNRSHPGRRPRIRSRRLSSTARAHSRRPCRRRLRQPLSQRTAPRSALLSLTC